MMEMVVTTVAIRRAKCHHQ